MENLTLWVYTGSYTIMDAMENYTRYYQYSYKSGWNPGYNKFESKNVLLGVLDESSGIRYYEDNKVNDGSTIYHCPVCDEEFIDQPNLETHLKYHHPDSLFGEEKLIV